MESKTIKKLKAKGHTSFMSLDPVDRVLQMGKIMHEIISARAEKEGVTEGEIYNRYLERDKRRRHSL